MSSGVLLSYPNDGLPLLTALLGRLIDNDKEKHEYTESILNFWNNCGAEFADLVSKNLVAYASHYCMM